MILDEAINHAIDISNKTDCDLCRNDHKQLAEWLKDYKRLLVKEQEENK